MAKCKFNKDVTALRGCFWKKYLEETLLSECFHILFLAQNCSLFVLSLTTDSLSIAII